MQVLNEFLSPDSVLFHSLYFLCCIKFVHSANMMELSLFYYSPSNVPLCSIEEVNQYLLSDSTCKCGLECPVVVSKTFNFDVSVESTKWSLELTKSSEDLTNLCNHRRKIINMASFQSSALTVTEEPGGGVVASSKSTDSKCQLRQVGQILSNKIVIFVLGHIWKFKSIKIS